MKKRIICWGKDNDGNRHFFAFGLNARENRVDGHIISADILTQEFENLLANQWREGGEVVFPKETVDFSTPLTVTETVVPEGFEIDNPSLLKRSQTEWNFMVMSQKLADLYHQEVEDFKDRIDQLTTFDSPVWESLKTFWGKVNEQIREKNLLREHATELHDQTNHLFDRMKELRKKMDHEFRAISEQNKNKVSEIMDAIEEKIDSGLSLQPIFNQLKKVQNDLKKTQLTKGHRRKLWDRIDKAFKAVKAKRYGGDGSDQTGGKTRLQHRYDGLLEVIQRMERSINRDRNDLSFQKDRINTTSGQLEAEIRKAKLQMIEERISSKEAKLADMKKTKDDLEKRLQKEKEKEAAREAKKKEAEAVAQAESEIKDKIADEMREAKQGRAEELDKLLQAADAINESKTSTKKEAEQEVEGDQELTITEFVTDQIEDIVDTARAVAGIVGRKIEKAVDDLGTKVEEE